LLGKSSQNVAGSDKPQIDENFTDLIARPLALKLQGTMQFLLLEEAFGDQ
jgi:hypothetical protein